MSPQVNHHIQLGGPQLDLPLPGGEGGEGHHQQEGAVELVLAEQVAQEGDGLDGFPQAHLVSQDAAVSPGGAQNQNNAEVSAKTGPQRRPARRDQYITTLETGGCSHLRRVMYQASASPLGI